MAIPIGRSPSGCASPGEHKGSEFGWGFGWGKLLHTNTERLKAHHQKFVHASIDVETHEVQGPPNTRRLRFAESRSTACGVRDQGSEIFVVYIGLQTQTSRFQNSRVQGLGISDLSLISGEGRRALRRIRIAPVMSFLGLDLSPTPVYLAQTFCMPEEAFAIFKWHRLMLGGRKPEDSCIGPRTSKAIFSRPRCTGATATATLSCM